MEPAKGVPYTPKIGRGGGGRRGFTSYKFKSPDQAHYLGLGTINCTLQMFFHNWKLGLVWPSTRQHTTSISPFWGHPVRWTPIYKPVTLLQPLAMGRLAGEQTNKQTPNEKKCGCPSMVVGWWVLVPCGWHNLPWPWCWSWMSEV